MADILIKISDEIVSFVNINGFIPQEYIKDVSKALLESTPLRKGHGRLIDIGKIDEDRIDDDNPIIYLAIDGNYIEAVSLDYLNGLPSIIEADKTESEDK